MTKKLVPRLVRFLFAVSAGCPRRPHQSKGNIRSSAANQPGWRARQAHLTLVAITVAFSATTIGIAYFQASTYVALHDGDAAKFSALPLQIISNINTNMEAQRQQPPDDAPQRYLASTTEMVKIDLPFWPFGQSQQRPGGNPLSNKPIRYLIGADSLGQGQDGTVAVVPYDFDHPLPHGITVAYCNLFDETNSGNYGPYLNSSGTAAQYNEGQIDPKGAGWLKNLNEQFSRRKAQGFEFVDIDNPDAYAIDDVIGAINLAQSYGLKVIAKNPGLLERNALAYVSHPNVYGIVVERDAGTPAEMDALRRRAGKADMPVWFIAFGDGKKWADDIASSAPAFQGMGVTYASSGEYANALDVAAPAAISNIAAR